MKVAIYLRKSRDEVGKDDVLSKHRDTLTSIANSNGWEYTLYEEIASGERIAYRPKMQQLLEDVEQGKYESVLVMDIDRLGRGNNKDWGEIYEAFCNDSFNTKIITPQRTYDLTEDTDEMMVDIQAFLAKAEYKTIKRRMLRGKIAGAKQGKWVCGKPPFPYKKVDGKIVADEDKAKVYRLMVDKLLNGESLEGVMTYLNLNHIPTPSGAIPSGKEHGWFYSQIRRIITSEVPLGYIVYGKTKGDSRRGNLEKIPENSWIKSKGEHPPLITQEEYDKIQRLIQSRIAIPKAARAGKHILSGLIVCKSCNHTMRIARSASGYNCVICNHKFRDGTRCHQRGVALKEEFYTALYNAVFEVDIGYLSKIKQTNNIQNEIKQIIMDNEKQLDKVKKALSRLYDLYEEGEIDKAEFTKRKKVRDKQKNEIEENLHKLKLQITPVESEQDFIKRLKKAKAQWLKATKNEVKNKLLHSLVQKIIYSRDGDKQPVLEILYK